jgi:hypothetical protein
MDAFFEHHRITRTASAFAYFSHTLPIIGLRFFSDRPGKVALAGQFEVEVWR